MIGKLTSIPGLFNNLLTIFYERTYFAVVLGSNSNKMLYRLLFWIIQLNGPFAEQNWKVPYRIQSRDDRHNAAFRR
jgi:hypothetical protein